MLYGGLISIVACMFCFSLFLVRQAIVLEKEFGKIQGDITLLLNEPQSEVNNGRITKISEKREESKLESIQNSESSQKISSRRVKREQGSRGASTSFLQLIPNTNKRLTLRGNITMIPWTVSTQQGNAISAKENRVVIQEDGYYLVFGQVLFENPATFMGHIIRSWRPNESRTGIREHLRCLKRMPVSNPHSTCYTAGIVQLHQNDELELVIPERPQALVRTDAESTFFGVIKLK